jgi:hypothetical protein
MSRKAAQAASGGEPSGAAGKKRKGGKGKGEAEAVDELAIRVGAHPRARRSIRRIRAQAGIAGFALTLVLAHQAGVPAFETLLRALAGGMVAHFVTWAFAIALWRRLIVVELEAARERILEQRGQTRAPAGDFGPSGAATALAKAAPGA